MIALPMAVELFLVLAGSLLLLLPGIFVANALRLGGNQLERLGFGSCLGLAAAVYLASLISHFDLRYFLPVWILCFLISLIAWRRRKALPCGLEIDPNQNWMLMLLLLVGISRYAVALPQVLPRGWDPSFHSLLARKIQITHHAISDWQTFESISLNYPTGSHTILAILSDIIGLPVHTVFKDLIPLLGILSTLQIYILTRRLVSHADVPFYAAAVYGLWALDGSINYYDWGGLPNELAMLLFIAMLGLWLDKPRPAIAIPILGILYAAVVLVHHHVMVVSGLILLVTLAYSLFKKDRAGWKNLAGGIAVAIVLTLYFLIPYAARAATLGATHIFKNGERHLDLLSLPIEMGKQYCALAIAGALIWLLRRGKPRVHSLVFCAGIPLAVGYTFCEYAWPAILAARGQPRSTAFTPSRFVHDLNYFLCVFVAIPIVCLQQRLRLSRWMVAALILLASLIGYRQWVDQFRSRPILDASIVAGDPQSFITACDWINRNTSSDTIVLNVNPWTSYFTWRRTRDTPIPFSEPSALESSFVEQFDGIVSGRVPPASPDMKIVVIADWNHGEFQSDLWRDDTGLHITQIWPPK